MCDAFAVCSHRVTHKTRKTLVGRFGFYERVGNNFGTKMKDRTNKLSLRARPLLILVWGFFWGHA